MSAEPGLNRMCRDEHPTLRFSSTEYDREGCPLCEERALTNAVVEAARPLRSIRGPMPLTPQTRELFGNLWAALDALDGERSE